MAGMTQGFVSVVRDTSDTSRNFRVILVIITLKFPFKRVLDVYSLALYHKMDSHPYIYEVHLNNQKNCQLPLIGCSVTVKIN